MVTHDSASTGDDAPRRGRDSAATGYARRRSLTVPSRGESRLPDATTWTLFLAAGFVLLVTPGPAVLYIVARSVHQGRRAGLVSCLGLTTGGLVHVVAAAAGLSAVLATSTTAFRIVRWAGAAYLAWLGLRTLLSGSPTDEVEASPRGGLWTVYRDGVVVNLLNPKAALFFLAFLPQFVDAGKGSVTTQIVALGLSFLLLGFVTDAAYALAAGSAGRWLRARPAVATAQRWLSGAVYLGLGVAATVADGPDR